MPLAAPVTSTVLPVMSTTTPPVSGRATPMRSVRLETHAPGDGVALNLTGAARYRGDDRLAPAEAHPALGREAMSRQHLHAEPGGSHIRLGSLELGHCALTGARLAL